MTGRPIRVGIIGVHPDKGWASTAHIPALRQLPDFALTVVSHHQVEVARAAAARFLIPHAVGSADDLVRHPDVDLVVVTVKVPRHRALVTAALDAGKTVLCEWPLGVNAADAAAMRDLARAKGVDGFIGIQTRAAAAVNFVRSLVRDGYVGRVISSTLIGSGILWGDAMPEGYAYTLDPASGASMLDVPLAHSIDAILYALESRVAHFTAMSTRVRQTVRISDTGKDLPMRVPDQVALAAQLESGVFINLHFRGGSSRCTNFHWEINGTAGDILVTSPVGYAGAGGFRVQGATADETLHDLPIPAEFDHGLPAGVSQSVTLAYRRLASDVLTGTRLSPTFDDAVDLHHLIAAIEHAAHAHGDR